MHPYAEQGQTDGQEREGGAVDRGGTQGQWILWDELNERDTDFGDINIYAIAQKQTIGQDDVDSLISYP